MQNRFGCKNATPWFVALATFFGLVFLVLTPPGQAPDEPAHVYRAWQVGHGILYTGSSKADVPDSLYQFLVSYIFLSFHAEQKVAASSIVKDVLHGEPINSDTRNGRIDAAIMLYSPILYVFSGLGMRIGEELGLSAAASFYLARLCNLAAWITIISLGLCRLKTFNRELCFLALLPMSVFQGMSASGDAVSNALGFFMFCCIIEVLFSAKPEKKDFYIAAAAAVCVAFAKQVTMLPFLLVWFARKKYPLPGNFWRYFILTGVLVWVAASWVLLNPAPNSALVDKKALVTLFFSSPYIPPKLLYESIVHHGEEWLLGYIGIFGWLDCHMPQWAYLLYQGCLVALFATQCRVPQPVSLGLRTGALGIVAVFSVIIMFSLFFTWPQIHQYVIEGVQGRYFIPMIPTLFIVCACFPSGRFKKLFDMAERCVFPLLLLLTVAGLSIASRTLYQRYFF